MILMKPISNFSICFFGMFGMPLLSICNISTLFLTILFAQNAENLFGFPFQISSCVKFLYHILLLIVLSWWAVSRLFFPVTYIFLNKVIPYLFSHEWIYVSVAGDCVLNVNCFGHKNSIKSSSLAHHVCGNYQAPIYANHTLILVLFSPHHIILPHRIKTGGIFWAQHVPGTIWLSLVI